MNYFLSAKKKKQKYGGDKSFFESFFFSTRCIEAFMIHDSVDMDDQTKLVKYGRTFDLCRKYEFAYLLFKLIFFY